MNCVADLVYDVGMHNGDDTAYYLHKGYRVVAIEANPVLAGACRGRFAAAVAAGRLQILNVGIAAEAGEADFFVSDVDVWSSFDRAAATRWGTGARTVRVRCVSFGDVIVSHGMPHYLKADIEGREELCLEALQPDTRPAFISIEMSLEHGDRHIGILREIGYSAFKCVRQNDLQLVRPKNVEREIALRRIRAGRGPHSFALRAMHWARRRVRSARDADWTFPSGSSGAFGEALPGEWMTVGEMLEVWRRLQQASSEPAHRRLEWWFDVHAS